MRKRAQAFSTLRSEGGLLPPDLLQKLTQVPPGVQGVDPASYELAPGERLNESILQSWNRLQKSWKDFASKKERLQNPATTTGFTNQSWTLPLLKELQFGALPQVSAPQVNGKTYAVERLFSHSPIHLVGYAVDLDRRTPGVRGASSASPHALLQELLNRFPTFQWGLLCNGVSLRILRKNQALSRQSFLEFDLETMFAGEVYPDFVLFWLVAHATRFAPRQPDRPETCWLESWSQTAQKEGTRAMTELRAGVEKALQALGEGLSSHPANTKLRERLRSGTLDANELHAQLLRVVYRLIFLFVSEDRELEGQSVLHPIDPTPAGKTARERYAAYYGTARLRDMAGKIQGSEHGDLWQQLQLLCRALSGDPELEDARRALALPALGSLLWDPASTEALNDCQLSNHDLLQTLRHLAYTRQGNVLRAVDYRNMGAEELSGLYESLLGLTPELSADGAGFHFVQYAGNERKTSGAYYTPDALVQSLLDSALEPVLQNAIAGKDPETAANAILQLKVCDPAVGPGHFLVGAAHRLAHHLASQRALQAGEAQPTASDHQHALREVIAHCLYGVDINPMAAELCRVSLWLEAMEPGKPLTFLDHHVRVGNSLLGATPQLISAGIPDDAFQAITGDDKAAVRELKKQNQKHARGLGPLFAQEDAKARQKLFEAAAALDAMDDAQLDDVRGKGKKFRELLQSTAFQNAWQLADLWCAAFVVPKLFEPTEPQPGFQLEGNPDQTQSQTGLFQEPPRRKTPKAKTPSGNNPPRGITNRHLAAAAQGKPLPEALSHQVKELAQAYAFFHWHLAFPEVFARGGFDCVLGNPPWERVKIQEKEWFSQRAPDIADAPNAAARKKAIEELEKEHPGLHRQFEQALRHSEAQSHFLRNGGGFPLCGRGDINVYTVFAEKVRQLLSTGGRAGCVVPTGIATDDTTKFFFQDVVETHSLVSLFDFENGGIFPGVHNSYKFCLFTVGSGKYQVSSLARFVFFAHDPLELSDPERAFELEPEDFALLNPNTLTCPIFRTRQDAQLTKAVYRRVPVLLREAREDREEQNPWGVSFKQGLFNMTSDSHRFRTFAQLAEEDWELEGNVFRKGTGRYLPLYEAKMIHHFDHRWATYSDEAGNPTSSCRDVTLEEKQDPHFSPLPRYWVSEGEVGDKMKHTTWNHPWFMGWRDITNATNEHTLVGGIFPLSGVGNNLPIWLSQEEVVFFPSVLSSFVADFFSRLKVGGTHLNFFIAKQLPVLSPTSLHENPFSKEIGIRNFLLPRILELTYTAWDMQPFAQECGWDGPPFCWDEQRRFLLRCELDAAFFHLYLPSTPNGEWQRATRATGAVRDESPEELQGLKAAFPTPRHAVAYIMDTFPIVKKRDEEAFGEYRTRNVVLDIYDQLAHALQTGTPYTTPLAPPPGSAAP